jgi:lipooligosaccharide transport system permease protein
MMQLKSFSCLFLKVWRRNLMTYQKIWKVNFLTPLLEPLFYIMAFGIGFSGLIDEVRYGGGTFAYPHFIAPALIATASMYNAFFETTYASFVRMYYQKTFDGMLATPLSLEEIIVAEIFWSATKSVAAVAIMTLVLGVTGFIAFPSGLLLIPLAFLGGIAFGAVGMFFTGIIPSIDMFNLPIFLFITPMFLFSGTFFPVSNLPPWVRPLAMAFPLHHLAELSRWCSLGTNETSPMLSIVFLIAFSTVFMGLSLKVMTKRLIH